MISINIQGLWMSNAWFALILFMNVNGFQKVTRYKLANLQLN